MCQIVGLSLISTTSCFNFSYENIVFIQTVKKILPKNGENLSFRLISGDFYVVSSMKLYILIQNKRAQIVHKKTTIPVNIRFIPII